ncbi:Large proline-rich protein bag6 [Castilleja foliolosa]|uniref:Large proline-rich protein bag6 n=1 Tax=Castilleja foliolosa TaxID=1961234 RepID=A0ABD3BFW5_9LAMI
MDHPIYRNMHSNPYQRDQIYYSPHFYPGTQMYANPSRPPINYGYAPQIPCHGCCNHHTCMPAHYPNWGSPYSHHFPAMPHCPVSYPSFPAQYMPCCPIEQHRYEIEKNVPTTRGQHCCGCPNHPSHPIEPGNVKIEEEPGSMAPFQLENGQSPIVLMPPDSNSKMKEQWKDNDNGGAKNGLYPLDLNNLVSMKKEIGDDGRKHQPHDEGEGQRFPLPFFWMPYMPEEKDKEMEKHKLGDLNTKPSLEPEMSFLGEKKNQVKEEGSKNRGREIDASVKDGGIDPGEKKLPKESVKRKHPSPPKSSKLPPVCLRVDPLPRRKTANGSSRSDEAKSKVTNSSDDKKVCDIIPTNEVKEGKLGKGTKMIEVIDGKTLQEKNMNVNVEARVDQPEVKPEEENDAMKGRQSEEVVSAIGNNEEGTKETSKRNLSEEEAAVIIQSVYRGFDTRRWDPVKNLKEIAEVRDQIDSLRHMIQAMESCSAIEGSSKQRNVISETIMSLLLKLDIIQGLHPSIREMRKSVVKELVSLQEQLDSIMIEKLSNSPQQESNLECEGDASHQIEDATLSKNSNEVPCDLSEADQNQLKGAVICENSETSKANEVLMDKIDKEDEKSNEGLKTDEISDRENLTLEDGSEAPKLPDSAKKGQDFAQSDRDELDSELAELPRGDLDNLYAQGNKTCPEEEGMLIEEATVTLESQNDERDDVMEADIKTGHKDKLEHEGPIEIKSGVEVTDANESFITVKPIENPPEKEISGDHLLHEGISEPDTVEETDTAVKKPENDTTEENANEDEKIAVRDEMEVLVHEKGEDLAESNRKLIAENERLRGVMENLMKSGQEQLTAISSLTGRVRDLERKLSKKKKLKMKQGKGKGRKMRTGLVHE